MSTQDLARVKGSSVIYHFADYVVILGKFLYVFSARGDLQYCQQNICYPYKATLVGAGLLLIQANKNYYLLRLKDGSIVWSIQRSGHLTFSDHFAVTSSGNFAYDGYSAIGGFYLVKLDLLNATKREYKIPLRSRAMSDIFCDGNDDPCVLQHQLIDPDQVNGSTNTIICLHENNVAWEKTWTFTDHKTPHSFFRNTETVLTHDLKLFHVPTKTTTNILSHETQWNPPKNWLSAFNIDARGRFMTIQYPHSNAVIDLSENRVVAQYAASYSQGIVIGDSFWVGSNKGVRIESFPIMEEANCDKPVFWSASQQ